MNGVMEPVNGPERRGGTPKALPDGAPENKKPGQHPDGPDRAAVQSPL